jgi:hypothetical protein
VTKFDSNKGFTFQIKGYQLKQARAKVLGWVKKKNFDVTKKKFTSFIDLGGVGED